MNNNKVTITVEIGKIEISKNDGERDFLIGTFHEGILVINKITKPGNFQFKFGDVNDDRFLSICDELNRNQSIQSVKCEIENTDKKHKDKYIKTLEDLGFRVDYDPAKNIFTTDEIELRC